MSSLTEKVEKAAIGSIIKAIEEQATAGRNFVVAMPCFKDMPAISDAINAKYPGLIITHGSKVTLVEW